MTAEKRFCTKCEKDKRKNDFYISYSPIHNGYIPICKPCLLSNVDDNDMNSVKDMLRMVDRPFIHYVWDAAINEGRSSVFGTYMKNVSMKQFRNLTWKDSIFTENDNKYYDEKNVKSPIPSPSSNFTLTDELIDKWGVGYELEEYRAFERKYHMLKNNYQEKTAMHTEALLTYIRYRVKEELATAQGDIKSAKEWGQLAQKAAQDAKINPSQLSKSDLSDGLDTFGQLVRSVEQAVDIIPILPQFKERPQDKVDFTILCYINYVRDLKGLPLATYEDIYRFYEDRKKEYETRGEEE